MGRPSATSHDAGLHALLWQACTHPLWWVAVSDLLLQRIAAMDVFRRCAAERDEHNRRKPASHYQSLFSAAGVAAITLFFPGLVDFGISFLMFIAMMAYYRIRPTAAILWLPVFLLLAILTALGVGLWLSALNAIYRDVRYVVPFLVQFWMFASPVAYPSSLVPEKWRWLYGLNPMAGVIEGFRWSLAGGEPPGQLIFVSAAVMIVVLLAGHMAYFQKNGDDDCGCGLTDERNRYQGRGPWQALSHRRARTLPRLARSVGARCDRTFPPQ